MANALSINRRLMLAACTFADRLRGAADNLVNRLTVSEASGNSYTAAASKPAARAAMVLR